MRIPSLSSDPIGRELRARLDAFDRRYDMFGPDAKNWDAESDEQLASDSWAGMQFLGPQRVEDGKIRPQGYYGPMTRNALVVAAMTTDDFAGSLGMVVIRDGRFGLVIMEYSQCRNCDTLERSRVPPDSVNEDQVIQEQLSRGTWADSFVDLLKTIDTDALRQSDEFEQGGLIACVIDTLSVNFAEPVLLRDAENKISF